MRCAICLALIVAVLTFLPSARQYSSARTLYASGYIPRPKIENIFAPTLLAVATALLCFAAQKWAIKWIVPAPRSKTMCANCGYELAGSSACPECNFPA
jgi:hypothetical protein